MPFCLTASSGTKSLCLVDCFSFCILIDFVLKYSVDSEFNLCIGLNEGILSNINMGAIRTTMERRGFL